MKQIKVSKEVYQIISKVAATEKMSVEKAADLVLEKALELCGKNAALKNLLQEITRVDKCLERGEILLDSQIKLYESYRNQYVEYKARCNAIGEAVAVRN